MTKSINIKVDDELWTSLKKYEEINWSGSIRNLLRNKLKEFKESKKFNKKLALKAFKNSQKLLETKAFTGRLGVDAIREWRNKRK